MGRVRPRGADGRGARPRGAGRPLARAARRGPPRGLRARLRRRARHVHAVLRLARARRRDAADPARSGSCRRTTSASSARSRRSSASSAATASCCATTRREAADGLPPGEGAFLPCSFWLADALTLIGRHDEARELFDRLTGLANDVGLLAEEYDPRLGRQVGNFPQAFTHVGLVNTARNLDRAAESPARERAEAGA